MANRAARISAIVLTCCILLSLATLGHHAFWRSHADLANVQIGGLVAVSLVTVGLNFWAIPKRAQGPNA